MTEWWYISTEAMTVAVRVEDGLVVEGPPIVRKFIGQPTRNLARWLHRQGGYRAARL